MVLVALLDLGKQPSGFEFDLQPPEIADQTAVLFSCISTKQAKWRSAPGKVLSFNCTHLFTDHPLNADCAQIFFICLSSNTENALEKNIPMVRNWAHPRSDTSGIVLLLVISSYTEKMPQLVTPQHYNTHLILIRRERLWLTGCFSSRFVSKQADNQFWITSLEEIWLLLSGAVCRKVFFSTWGASGPQIPGLPIAQTKITLSHVKNSIFTTHIGIARLI